MVDVHEQNEIKQPPGTARIDLDAIRHNLVTLKECAPRSEVMAVVKADAYGHGRLPVALAAKSVGITWFGVSQVEEGIKFRTELDGAGVPRSEVKILAWLAGPDQDWQRALRADLELAASSTAVLERIAAAAETLGQVAPVHLKVDVGMSRAGALGQDFEDLVLRARELEKCKLIRVDGIWSHLPAADDLSAEGIAAVQAQVETFEAAVAQAEVAGLQPHWRHLAATSGTLWHPSTHGNMVRVGIGMYGLSPDPEVAGSEQLGLRPALRLEAPIVLVKHLPTGSAVSYGGTWRADRPTWVGLVPLGYADGIPRHASNVGPVTVHGDAGAYATRVLGRVCMDQFVVSLGTGAEPVALEGDRAELIGPGKTESTADGWARACNTINYEIVTRLAPTIRREYFEGGIQ